MGSKEFDEAVGALEAGPASPESAGSGDGGASGAASHPTVTALRERFGDAVLHHAVMAGDEHVVRVPAERLLEILSWLKTDPDQLYDYLADLTAVDWGGGRPLELVYQLWSMSNRRALRVKATIPLNALEADTVSQLWKTANWLEREVWDLFGIRFRGHPDLRRILMPEGYAEGFPLRKDFPLRGRFSRSEQTRRALSIPVREDYSPEELAAVPEAKPQSGGSSGGGGGGG